MFPDAAGGGADRQILKSRSMLMSTHPGMQYFRNGNPRCCLRAPHSCIRHQTILPQHEVQHNKGFLPFEGPRDGPPEGLAQARPGPAQDQLSLALPKYGLAWPKPGLGQISENMGT